MWSSSRGTDIMWCISVSLKYDGQGEGGDVACCGLLLGILLHVAWCCVMWGWWCCMAWCGVMMYEAREV